MKISTVLSPLAAALAFLSIVLSGGIACAEDMSDIYSLALKQDPRFLGSEFQHEASQETLKQAYAEYYPTVMGEGSYTYSSQDIVSSDNEVFDTGKTDFDTQDYTLTLSQPLFNYSYIVGVRQAKSVIERSDMELELARQELILRVSEAYLTALAARDNLDYAQSEEEIDKQHLEDATARHEAGLVPVTDVYDARARYASVQAQRVEGEHLLDDALQALKEIAGEPVESLAGLKEEMPLAGPVPADAESWATAALGQNLGVNIQQHEVDIAREEVNRQRSGHYPTLDLVGRYNKQETDGTLFGGGSEVDTTDIFVSLKIPIFEGGLVSSRTREAKSLNAKAEEKLTELTRSVDREARASYSGVKTAISKVESLQKSIESQELVLEAKKEGFESGLFTSLAVLDASRDLYFYKRDHSKARYDYILNNLKLRQAVGTLTENDLNQVNAWLK